MSIRERRKRNRKTTLVIAVMLSAFALVTYIMTFVIAHLLR